MIDQLIIYDYIKFFNTLTLPSFRYLTKSGPGDERHEITVTTNSGRDVGTTVRTVVHKQKPKIP